MTKYQKDCLILFVIWTCVLFAVGWLAIATFITIWPLLQSPLVTLWFKLFAAIMCFAAAILTVVSCVGLSRDTILLFLKKYHPRSFLLKEVF